jgi:hypothetical protein
LNEINVTAYPLAAEGIVATAKTRLKAVPLRRLWAAGMIAGRALCLRRLTSQRRRLTEKSVV